MRAQEIAAGEPEGVLHVARGVVRRDVEGVEVVVLGFDFGAVENGESERGEDVLDFRLDAADGMQMAAGGRGRGQREIDPLGVEAGLGGGGLEARLAGLERGFETLLDGVQQLAGAGALLGRELAEVLRDLREGALASEDLDADGFEARGGGLGFDLLARARVQFRESLLQHG